MIYDAMMRSASASSTCDMSMICIYSICASSMKRLKGLFLSTMLFPSYPCSPIHVAAYGFRIVVMLATTNPERTVGDPQRHSVDFKCIIEERYDRL